MTYDCENEKYQFHGSTGTYNINIIHVQSEFADTHVSYIGRALGYSL